MLFGVLSHRIYVRGGCEAIEKVRFVGAQDAMTIVLKYSAQLNFR